MKPHPDETYESWSERVRMFEHGHAMMQIAQGKDVEKVMEDMSRRMMAKLLHPVFQAIRNSGDLAQYNSELEKESYKKRYLDKNPNGIADHVDTDT